MTDPDTPLARSKRRSARLVWGLVVIQILLLAVLPDNFLQWLFLSWTLCAAVFLSRLRRVATPDVEGLNHLVRDHVGYAAVATVTLAFCGLLRLT
jgi:hypothetical protein